MNRQQRIDAIRRVLKEDSPISEIEYTRDYNGVAFYRLRNSRRVELAERIEIALREK